MKDAWKIIGMYLVGGLLFWLGVFLFIRIILYVSHHLIWTP